MGSLVKYLNQREAPNLGGALTRGPLHWGRHDVDGKPMRGSHPPLYRSEEEADQAIVRVGDFKVGIFDLWSLHGYVDAEGTPVYGRNDYIEVMDRVINDWFKLLHINRQYDDDKRYIYLEWAEIYCEDGKSRSQF